jgi:lipocalin
VSFPGGHWKDYNNGEYRIINTDFKNYSVVYSCKQIDENNKFELVWVLARDPQKISENTLKAWINYLDTKFRYKSEELIVTKHDTAKCRLVDGKDKKIKRDILC